MFPKGYLRETSNIYTEVQEMKAVIRRYELTDAEWERLKEYFPDRQAGDKGRPRKDSQQILNGILWIARSGAAWRDLPERYGAWQTTYKRFVQWQEAGLLEQIPMISVRMQIYRISASTARTSRLTRRAQEPQKRGMRSPKPTPKRMHRSEPRRAQHEDSRSR